MGKRLLDGDALVGVVRQHLLDEVNGLRVGALKQLIKVLPFALRQAHHEFFVLAIFDFVDQLLVRVAEQVIDLLHLLVLILRRQEGFAREEFAENATDGPDVNRARVLLLREDDFRSAVPSR